MTVQLILFISLALAAIATALGMLFSRSAIYSALYLVLNFATVAIFYLLLNAPFLAVAQVTVYAGAIMVLFLFVIMLLGPERLSPQDRLAWQRPLAIVLSVILLAEAAYVLIAQRSAGEQSVILPDNFGSPAQVGLDLFSQYLLPFEVTSILLLVAMVGAIVLTRDEKKK
ncbi:MAG: NADH-quinone oxidoreductase subunit J [Anaerolineales bacterium]|nr:NADH-quinone oxidoreductase subunit J [Anaerolineales bacterium]